MVRIVIETEAGSDQTATIVSQSPSAAAGDDVNGGAGPGGVDADVSGAPADSANGGGPPDWLVSAIEAAERGDGQSGPQAGTDGVEDGGAGPEM